MQSYFKAKLHLFKNILLKNKAIISDKSSKEFITLKKISKQRRLRLIDINKIEKKLKKNNKIKSLNEFQLKNLSMAILAARMCNVNEKNIFRILHKIKGVSGRLELVRVFPNNIRVFVDFAHTPDALLKTIIALKSQNENKISIVFGCGGDRDIKKRPLMARIVKEHCEKIYVTDDNPRNEKPGKIRQEILRNLKKDNSYNIKNRTNAIRTAIKNASPNEVILIAGKGHETEQIYKDKVLFMSDKQVVKKLNLKIKKNFTE